MNKSLFVRIRVILSWIIYLPIVGISYIVAWLDRTLRFPLSFPRDVTQLDARKPWLIAELKKNNALPSDAVIDSCEVKPLKQETIFRSNAGIINIQYTDGGQKKTLKCFAKFAPTMGTVWNRTIFNLQMNHIKEIWFNEYFLKVDTEVPAPVVYIARLSVLTGNLCLITEHMGDDIEYLEYPYKSFPQYHLDLALDGLASLHARYWGDTSKRMAHVLPIEDATVHFFDSMVAGRWSIPARKVLIDSWCLMNQRQTVLHGDSRIGNMMFPSAPGQGRYVLIDWQATRSGKAAFDLAYFLILSLISHHRQAVETESIDAYYRSLITKGVKNYSREDLEEDYRHACLCTLVLLALPMLSGEASVEGLGAQIFVFGMGIWRERLRMRFESFDYAWMADRYHITEQESRDAVREMLDVIESRLNRILVDNSYTETIADILRRNNEAGEFDV